MNNIKLFADCRCNLSESPIWNPKEQLLYWRGSEGEIYRKAYDSPVDDYECFRLNIGAIGSIVLTKEDYILLFGENGKIFKWIVGNDPILYKDFNKNLFNDCLVDPEGRVYCGMLTENYFDSKNRGKYGSFWRLDRDGNLVCLESKIGNTPNGIRFSPDLTKLYFGVTDEDLIYEYDYDRKIGNLTNRKVFATDCFPDGMTIDKDGNLWVAKCRPGSPLICYSPNGVVIDKIHIPVHRIISVCFGGPDNTSLFVTTASEGQAVGEHDGGVFIIENIGIGADEFIY